MSALIFPSVDSAQPGKFTKEIKNVKSQLELIDVEKYRSAMIRARAERLWSGETPTKGTLGEEERYATQNEMKEIQFGNAVTRGRKTIERAFVEYCRDLLGHKTQVEEGFEREFLPLPKLYDDAKANQEAPITGLEIERAIDEIK